MTSSYDVIIVGSGPAGVSAAFPLVEKGLKVLMLDGGASSSKAVINEKYLELRAADTSQWRWMIGEDFHSLKMRDSVSPKLRIPGLSYVFKNYIDKLKIQTNNFISVGSLAPGGLSNVWGAGIACYSHHELRSFPFPVENILSSYKYVTDRIGTSGNVQDDLTDYFGLHESSSSIVLDDLHTSLLSTYQHRRSKLKNNGFRLGRARIAVLNKDKNDRKACSLMGNCLWGCSNKAVYSAAYDIDQLKKFDNFNYISGFYVENLHADQDGWLVQGENTLYKLPMHLSAKKVLLAAGTLGTTKLALKTLETSSKVNILSSPTAAFLLWLPRFLGRSRQSGFGLAQSAYTLEVNEDITAFGATFSTTGIPISEFAKHVPFKRSNSIDILSVLMSSCVVGNVFLPGHLTNATAQLLKNGTFHVEGNYHDSVFDMMSYVAKQLRKNFMNCGALVLPGSFTVGKPGGDIHYAGTLPMRLNPGLGESNANGELAGTKNLYIVDGAALPILPEKSHTLTVMANADRIGRILANAKDI